METEEEARTARELGCDTAQGYLYCPPVPPEGLPPALAALQGGREG